MVGGEDKHCLKRKGTLITCCLSLESDIETRNACEQYQKQRRGVFLAKRYCEYNGCSGCYSEHVSEELNQVCKKHYKNLDYVWRTYECCVHTPLVCNVSWLIRSVGRYCKSKERMW